MTPVRPKLTEHVSPQVATVAAASVVKLNDVALHDEVSRLTESTQAPGSAVELEKQEKVLPPARPSRSIARSRASTRLDRGHVLPP